MTIVISSAVGDQSIGTEPVVITQSGVVNGATALNYLNAELGNVIVAGSVFGTSYGAGLDQGDRITIASSGMVAGIGGNGAEAIRVMGTDNIVTVHGSVIGVDAGILGLTNSDMLVVVSGSGTVQGGSNGNGLDSGSYSAAIASFSTMTIENAGTIIGELNPDNGLRVAIVNAAEDLFDPTGFDLDFNAVTTVTNSGAIIGDVLLGGGNDVYHGKSGGFVDGKIDMGSGRDTMLGSHEAEFAVGGEGVDILLGRGGDDDLRGGAGADVVRGGKDDDFVTGGSGSDDLRGGRDDDVLRGGSGGDTLNGGSGDDGLFGDSNADLFIFKGDFGNDLIYDFEDNNAEKIDLTNVGSIRNFNDLSNNHLSEVDGSAVISDGQGNSITLLGFAAADLDAGDFIF